METYSKIAVFRALHLGDMLCIIPTIRAIRVAYPKASITLIGLPWQRDLASRFHHYFNDFIVFPGWPGLPEQAVERERVVNFLQEMQKREFDLILQLQGNGILTNSLCMLWNGKRVSGLRKNGEWAPNGAFFPVSEDSDHEILRFLKILDCLSIPRQGTHLEFPIMDKELLSFGNIRQQLGLHNEKYVCIHPGARDPRRRWPADNFALLADQMASHGFTIVLTGSLEEKTLLLDLQKKIKTPTRNIVEVLGHTSAGELACIIKHSVLLISNDTGVSHIAAALNVPSIILFSPYSDYGRWRPLNADTHVAIPSEKTNDIQYVLRCVDRTLSLLVDGRRSTVHSNSDEYGN